MEHLSKLIVKIVRESLQLANLTLVPFFFLVRSEALFQLSRSLSENYLRFGIKGTFPFIFEQNSHKSLWLLWYDPE